MAFEPWLPCFHAASHTHENMTTPASTGPTGLSILPKWQPSFRRRRHLLDDRIQLLHGHVDLLNPGVLFRRGSVDIQDELRGALDFRDHQGQQLAGLLGHRCGLAGEFANFRSSTTERSPACAPRRAPRQRLCIALLRGRLQWRRPGPAGWLAWRSLREC